MELGALQNKVTKGVTRPQTCDAVGQTGESKAMDEVVCFLREAPTNLRFALSRFHYRYVRREPRYL